MIDKSTANDKINILYVDDEVDNLKAFKAAFRRDFKIHIVESPAEGRKVLDEHPIEIILTDQRMPEMTGVEFLESIIPDYPNTMRILITGYSDIDAVIDAINKGQVYRYVSKPWNYDDLKMIIESSYEVYKLRKENKELTEKLIQVNNQLEFMLRQKLIS